MKAGKNNRAADDHGFSRIGSEVNFFPVRIIGEIRGFVLSRCNLSLPIKHLYIIKVSPSSKKIAAFLLPSAAVPLGRVLSRLIR